MIVVTGGAGFIGSALVRKLRDRGEDVTVIDDFSTGKHRMDGVNYIRDDVRFARIPQCTHIYNLACPASPPQYQANPVKTFLTSTEGMANVLQWANNWNARALQASTSEIYGDPTIHPQTENYWGNVNPIGPRACYDEGKRAAETLCAIFHQRYATDVRIARIFNTYGPGMAPDDGRVVSNFITQALAGKPITIYGNGTQTRSFCYVDDMVNGLISLMEHPETEWIGPVNLGNPFEINIRELAGMIVRMARSKSEIVYRELPQDDPTQRRPDISKATATLGWQPSVPLIEGLERTISYFRGIME